MKDAQSALSGATRRWKSDCRRGTNYLRAERLQIAVPLTTDSSITPCSGRTIPADLKVAPLSGEELSGAGDNAPAITQAIPFRHCHRYGHHHN